MTVNSESKTVPSENGHAQAEFVIENVHLWDGVDDPYLYTATAKLDSGDEISARFGCREFKCDPEKGFFLNGRSYPLRGVSRHQDLKGKGNALLKGDHAVIWPSSGKSPAPCAWPTPALGILRSVRRERHRGVGGIPYITMHMTNGRENTLSQMRS